MRSVKSFARVALVAAIALGLSSPRAAEAQSTTLDQFRPAPLSRDGFAVSAAETNGRLKLDAQLYLDYANDPLVYEARLGDMSSEQQHIVRHQLAVHAMFALTIRNRLALFAGIPVNAIMKGDAPPAGIFGADGASVGDAWVGARLRLFGKAEGFAVAVQGTLVLPSSQLQKGTHYAGEEMIAFRPQLLAQYRLPHFRVAANVGVIVRRPQDVGGGIDIGQQLTFGLGVAVPLFDEKLSLLVEAHGLTALDDFGDREKTPLEVLGGARYYTASGIHFGVGGGAGVLRGFGSPDYRILGTLGFARDFRTVAGDADHDGINDDDDQCVNEPEDRDNYRDTDGCPDTDNDGDQILDVSDQCPNDPEDVDSFEDENGCPDPDNDGDGILDANDRCPNEAEDADGFQDEDGCPDPDNDNDNVPDLQDRCPLVAGILELQGCPDPDRDGDGVPDRIDNCPDEPGPAENQGCQERQQVRIEGGQIAILDSVYFRTNSAVIQPRSFALLDNVARVISAHSEITSIRVEGHTDARGNHDKNVRLSQTRAESVKRYLVEHGVAEGRLTAQGFGPDRPIVPNATSAEDHARNRRVEFHLEGAQGVENRTTGPAADTIDR